MTMPYAHGDSPLIPRPELTLPALRQAVATVVPSRLPEFFEDLQRAFVRAGDEDSVVPIRMFYRRWGVVVEVERHPETARRLHAAERAISSPDPAVRDRAIREAGEIVCAAHREVAAGSGDGFRPYGETPRDVTEGQSAVSRKAAVSSAGYGAGSGSGWPRSTLISES
ncbi:hypothetical protein OG762_14840 [Streptomyces sp. NBC_01136]|uniref:hypothetical protein n=1 Tax=Streptomyces sp. NBC_01136 TaxID=2903754 RepID=UPI003863D381|nr:hypothetical protein OG762_14840 [Streptomyces sp. NBC_01136]